MYNVPPSPDWITCFLALESLQTPFGPLQLVEKSENVRIIEKQTFEILHQGFSLPMLGTAWSHSSRGFARGTSPAAPGAGAGRTRRRELLICRYFTCVEHPSHESCFGTREGLMFILAAFAVRVLNPFLWASCSRLGPWSKRYLIRVSTEKGICWSERNHTASLPGQVLLTCQLQTGAKA